MSNKFLEKIFSVKNRDNHKVINILGLKTKFKRNDVLLNSRLQELISQIQGNSIKLTEICSKDKCCIDPKEYWWRKENFEFFQDYENLEKKYISLIKGMDKSSIDLITRIISRIQSFVLEGKVNFLLTNEEKKQKKIFDRFVEENIKLANGNYARKGYILPQKDMEISVLEYRHGLDCVEHPEKFKDKDIIDVGGYIGDSAIVFSELTCKNIHTFEPCEEEYNKILKTIKLNGKSNIIPNNFALGAEKKTEVIKCDDLGAAIESVSNYTLPDIPVADIKVSTLDKYVKDNNLQVGLIKVDIEGYEQEFLKGALETIRTQKPTLILSIYHNASDFFDIKPLIENLDLGYKFKVHKPFDYTIVAETVLICEVRD